MTAHVAHAAGQGPAVVLIHGFGADRLGWAATIPVLSAGYSVWTVDLPGHGRAGAAPRPAGPAALAAAVRAALSGAGVPQPMALIGHSLGGAVALHLADRSDLQVSGVIAIAPVGLGAGLDMEFVAAFAELAEEEAALALLRRLVVRPGLVLPAMAAHVLRMLAEPGRRDDLRAIAATLAATVTPIPDVPVTLIWGAEDRINPAGLPVAGLPPETVHVIPKAGHLPQVEATGAVNRVLMATLAGFAGFAA